MNGNIRRRDAVVTALACLAGSAAWGQGTGDTSAVRIIVPFGATTGTDTIARLIANKLIIAWSRPVHVENIPGAGGVVGTQVLQRAAPDGRTIGIVPSTHVVNAALYSKLPYDPINDFTPVMKLGASALVIVAPADGFRSLRELISNARANPDKISYGSVGNGSSTHLAIELLQSSTGVRMVHIPYRTSGQLMTDLIAGRVSLAAVAIVTGLAQIKAGSLRALAVTSSRPVSMLPDVPAAAEMAPGYELAPWFGVVGPKGLPQTMVDRLQADIGHILRDPQVVAQLAGMGIEPRVVPAEEFWSSAKSEIAIWTKIVRDAKIELEATPR